MEELKDQPDLYHEIMAKIKSLRQSKSKNNDEKLKDKVKHVLDIEGTTDFNIRVKLPNKED